MEEKDSWWRNHEGCVKQTPTRGKRELLRVLGVSGVGVPTVLGFGGHSCRADVKAIMIYRV